MADKISPSDPRITFKTALLNGLEYNYIESLPAEGTPIQHTVFLIHGWPDLSMGWRYQIPLLTSLGFRVIAPDMMGYGRTSAPESPEFYTYKRTSDDMAALAASIGVSSIILGGHDWGGAVAYRFAMYYPSLISALFVICTPFTQPRKYFVDGAEKLPNFKYQLQLRGPDVEAAIVGEEKIRAFLHALYGGRTKSGEPAFSVDHGLHLDRITEGVSASPLLSPSEMDFYVSQYSIHGLHGPLNWYRTTELNYNDDLEHLIPKMEAVEKEGYKFEMPTLFIAGSKDAALPPSMSRGMDAWFKDLRREEVDAYHWALWEKPMEVNALIRGWMEEKLAGVGSKL